MFPFHEEATKLIFYHVFATKPSPVLLVKHNISSTTAAACLRMVYFGIRKVGPNVGTMLYGATMGW